jgi:putative ABC transport system substrate-binding protein
MRVLVNGVRLFFEANGGSQRRPPCPWRSDRAREAGVVRRRRAPRSSLTRERPQALLVIGNPYLVSQRRRLAQIALKMRLPSAYTYREHAEAGGLIAYAPNYHDLFRRAAGYVDRVLKGTKPGDLPIEQATKFDLIINLKTAKALGLTIPPSLLLRADQVIE